MQPRHFRVDHGLLARLQDAGLDVFLRLRDHLLDARRMDAPVDDQLRQRAARDFAPDGIEGREHDGFGCVVDDDVDPGQCLEGADVAPFAPDDASLDVVRGQRDDADGRFRDALHGQALDRRRDDVARAAVGFGAGFVFDPPYEDRAFVTGLILHLAQ